MLTHTPRKGELVAYHDGTEKPDRVFEVTSYRDEERTIANVRDWITGEMDIIIVRFYDGTFNRLLDHYQDENDVNYTTQPRMFA